MRWWNDAIEKICDNNSILLPLISVPRIDLQEELKLPTRILVIDSDVSAYNQLVSQIENYPVSTMWARDVETAMYLHETQNFDAAIVQREFEKLPGLAVVQKLRNQEEGKGRYTGMIISTGDRLDKDEKSLYSELGDMEMVSKPYQAVKVIPVFHKTALKKERHESLIKSYDEAIKKTLYEGDTVERTEKLITRHLSSSKSRAVSALISFYMNTANYERGLVVTRTLLKGRPADISLLNAQSKFLLKLGRNEDALKVMKVCDSVAPGNIERIERMVDAYLETKQPEKSIEKMRELTALHPEQPDFKFQMFNKLFDHGYDEHCYDYCRDTTTPKDVLKYFNNRGVLFSRQGRHKHAISLYRKALNIYPDFPGNYRIYYNIALAILKSDEKNRKQSAMTELNKCLALNPTFEKARDLFERIRPKG